MLNTLVIIVIILFVMFTRKFKKILYRHLTSIKNEEKNLLNSAG